MHGEKDVEAHRQPSTARAAEGKTQGRVAGACMDALRADVDRHAGRSLALPAATAVVVAYGYSIFALTTRQPAVAAVIRSGTETSEPAAVDATSHSHPDLPLEACRARSNG